MIMCLMMFYGCGGSGDIGPAGITGPAGVNGTNGIDGDQGVAGEDGNNDSIVYIYENASDDTFEIGNIIPVDVSSFFDQFFDAGYEVNYQSENICGITYNNLELDNKHISFSASYGIYPNCYISSASLYFYEDNLQHRLKYPSFIHFNKNGITSERWYFQGISFNSNNLPNNAKTIKYSYYENTTELYYIRVMCNDESTGYRTYDSSGNEISRTGCDFPDSDINQSVRDELGI